MQQAQPTIFIHMLGAFEVFRDGVKIAPAEFGSRKARELFRWLVDARDTVVPRDVLLEALWPDEDANRMLGSFRVRISEVRKLISSDETSPPLLERVDNGYILRTVPGYLETDADRFEALAATALNASRLEDALPRLQQAVLLYKGDYIADDPYTVQWHGERERYRMLFSTVAGRLAEVYETVGEYEEGIQLLQRLLAQPHRDESIYRTLIRLQYLNGDQAGALRTFQQCRTYLQTEHGAKPMPETLRLLKQVMRHEPLPAPVAGPTPHDAGQSREHAAVEWPFLGRQAELTQLRQHMAALRDGQGGIVWLHGPSGIGKTRLLREALAGEGLDRGFRTMWIQGTFLNSRIPFAAILDGLQIGLEPDITGEHMRQLMTSSAPHLQQLTGGKSADGTPPAGPMHDVILRQEILKLLELLTQQMPLLCCIDDVQALDPASRSLWLAVANRTSRWPLLIVATSQRAPQQIDVGYELMHAATRPTIIPLEPLTAAALRPLVGRGIPSLWSEQWLGQLHDETGGEPFVLIAHLHALRQRNLIDIEHGQVVFPTGLLELMTDPGATEVAAAYLPERQDDFQDAWDRLDDRQRGLLQKAAALKDCLTMQRLQRLSTKPQSEYEVVLEGLIRHGYFTMGATAAEDTKLSFAHSRLQHRIYHTMTRPERMWYHRRIFDLLQAENDVTEDQSAVLRSRALSAIAFHALLAEQWEDAARWSLRAAAATNEFAPGLEVVALCRQAYQAAQRLAPGTMDELVDETRWAFADALFRVGSFREAISMYESLTHVPASRRRLVDDRLIEMYLQLGDTAQARCLAEKAVKRAGRNVQARAIATLNRAFVHYRSGDLTQAIAEGSEAIVQLKQGGMDKKRAAAHQQMALYFWDLGEYGLALKHATDGTELRRALEKPELITSLNQLGELYQDLFCTTFAMEAHREALDLALSHGKLVLSIEIWRNLGLNFVHEGRIEKGLQALKQAWQQVQDLNLGPYSREVHLRSLLEAKLLAHEPGDVRLLLDQYKDVAGPREKPFVTMFSMGLALLEGRIDEAERFLADAQTFWHRTGRRARASHVLLFAGQELMVLGHDERAQRYLQLALEELERIGRLVPPLVAQQIRASRQYTAAQQLLYTM